MIKQKIYKGEHQILFKDYIINPTDPAAVITQL